MKRKLPILIAILLMIGFAGLAIKGATSFKQKLHHTNIQLESKTFQLNKLEVDYKKLNQDLEAEKHKKTLDQQRIDQLEKEKSDLEQRYKALEVSKANQKAEQQRIAQAAKKVTNVVTPTASASGNCGDNIYKQFIYQKESGCRTTAVNSIGCRGIGQACPGSKLPCGDDFACQDAFFSNYAIARYGSWEAAYGFWLKNHWW